MMCVLFLMEGNRENQDRIRALEKYNQDRDGPKGTTPVEQSLREKMEKAGVTGVPVNVKVPDEVLDQQGYETYMDGKGQVMLRKRQPPGTGTGTGPSLCRRQHKSPASQTNNPFPLLAPRTTQTPATSALRNPIQIRSTNPSQILSSLHTRK